VLGLESSEQTAGGRELDRLAFWVLGAVKSCGIGCEILVLAVGKTLTLSGRTWGTETPKVQLNFPVRRGCT
jgi:hypothetical protein